MNADFEAIALRLRLTEPDCFGEMGPPGLEPGTNRL